MKKGAALLVAGTHGGSGKTIVSCAILAALRKRGLKVQPFKAGADYLDPGYLALAAGRPCYNLDLWLMPRKVVKAAFSARMAGADVAVIDGMAGLCDGVGIEGEEVSSAHLASQLRVPVLLVVDARGMAESAAAIVHGFASYGRAEIAGVIFNRVAGLHHFEVLKRAVGPKGGVKVCGWLPEDPDLEMSGRSLGLVAADAHRAEEVFAALQTWLEKTIDLEAVLAAAEAPPLTPPQPARTQVGRARIAVARDAAFHFYYEDNLDALRAAGADLVPFSPLTDAQLPAGTAGLYLGGGFPESQAARLEENRTMRESIRGAIESGMPTYAECGGLMYLSAHLVGTGVRAWEMVGALPGEVRLERGLQRSGYVTADAERGTFLVEKGESLRGHEFHSAVWTGVKDETSIYSVSRPGRKESRPEGFGAERLHASCVHLHFASAPQIPARFVKAAADFAKAPRKKK